MKKWNFFSQIQRRWSAHKCATFLLVRNDALTYKNIYAKFGYKLNTILQNPIDYGKFEWYSRVVFTLVVLFDACIIPYTTAANEVWWDTWRCIDGEVACGAPACIGPCITIWFNETPFPNTQYVVMIPFPLTLISPRFCGTEFKLQKIIAAKENQSKNLQHKYILSISTFVRYNQVLGFSNFPR